MKILDANILLYAYIPSYEQHQAAKKWLETMLSEGNEIIGLSWQIITAFIRIGTNPKVFNVPFKVEDAITNLGELFEHPLVEIILPTAKHWDIFSEILEKEQITANLVMDAHLAALAIEHGAILVTTDRDFARFSKAKTINPLKS